MQVFLQETGQEPRGLLEGGFCNGDFVDALRLVAEHLEHHPESKAFIETGDTTGFLHQTGPRIVLRLSEPVRL